MNQYRWLWFFATYVAVTSMVVASAESDERVIYVSVSGSDADPGTREKPVATLKRALAIARQARRRDGAAGIAIEITDGTYYLGETLVLTDEDSGTESAPLVIRGAEGATPVISGGAKLDLKWERTSGKLQAQVPVGIVFDQLFVDGQRQHLARYPNYDPDAQYFNGVAADAIDPQRIKAKGWANPAGGFLHAMHRNHWGDLVWRITGLNDEREVTLEGGWQNNRPTPPHRSHRYVSNVLEELDAPGEWFLDTHASTLYYILPPDVDLARAKCEAPLLRHLIELRGNEQNPVRHVQFRGLKFTHTLHTFMDNKEPLLRSDWTVYRGGAIVFDGAEDCGIYDCHIEQVGGNGVFVNNYNRRIEIVGSLIRDVGSNGIAFVGDPAAVRSPRFNYGQTFSYDEIDKAEGPLTNNFPADCRVHDCLITRTGRTVKQTAPVQISMSQSITVSHCSIYDVPRAGINISEGTWGGHVIEFCDVFDTVKETGDHGSFNSWGRDRFWHLRGFDNDQLGVGQYLGLPLLDVVKPVILRNNRWRCDRGWDIDLDDGSSNYRVYNNLCLNGGIKNREGFFRIVENNIMVNNGFHPHVWYKNSHDIVRRNILFSDRYHPAGGMPQTPWGKQMDYNLVHRAGTESSPAKQLQLQSQRDEHSLVGDALFVDPAKGDYRVRDGSAALELGFKNFPMDQFGVVKPELKEMARTPKLPAVAGIDSSVRHGPSQRSKRPHR